MRINLNELMFFKLCSLFDLLDSFISVTVFCKISRSFLENSLIFYTWTQCSLFYCCITQSKCVYILIHVLWRSATASVPWNFRTFMLWRYSAIKYVLLFVAFMMCLLHFKKYAKSYRLYCVIYILTRSLSKLVVRW